MNLSVRGRRVAADAVAFARVGALRYACRTPPAWFCGAEGRRSAEGEAPNRDRSERWKTLHPGRDPRPHGSSRVCRSSRLASGRKLIRRSGTADPTEGISDELRL